MTARDSVIRRRRIVREPASPLAPERVVEREPVAAEVDVVRTRGWANLRNEVCGELSRFGRRVHAHELREERTA